MTKKARRKASKEKQQARKQPSYIRPTDAQGETPNAPTAHLDIELNRSLGQLAGITRWLTDDQTHTCLSVYADRFTRAYEQVSELRDEQMYSFSNEIEVDTKRYRVWDKQTPYYVWYRIKLLHFLVTLLLLITTKHLWNC